MADFIGENSICVIFVKKLLLKSEQENKRPLFASLYLINLTYIHLQLCKSKYIMKAKTKKEETEGHYYYRFERALKNHTAGNLCVPGVICLVLC